MKKLSFLCVLIILGCLPIILGSVQQIINASAPSSGGATYTYIGGVLGIQASGATTSYSPTAGHTVVIGSYACADTGACTASTTGVTLTISDNINNPETCFTAAPSSPVQVADSGGFKEVWYWWVCPSIPAGVTYFITNSSTGGGSDFNPRWIVDFTCSGCTGAWDKDGTGHSSASGTTGTAPTTGATTNAKEFCVGMVDNDADESQSSFGGSWAQHYNDGTGNGVLQTLSTSGTGTQTVSATWTGSDSWFAEIGCVE